MESTQLGRPTLLASAWRQRALVATAIVVGGLLGVTFFSVLSPSPEFRADATLVVSEANAGIGGAQGDRFVANQVEILRSAGVLARTAAILQDGEPSVVYTVEELSDSLTVSARSGTGVIRVDFTSDEEALAIEVVNTLVEAYREVSRAELDDSAANAISRIEAEVGQLNDRIEAINAEIENRTSAVVGIDALRTQMLDAINELSSLQQAYDALGITDVQRQDLDTRRTELSTRIEIFRTAQAAQVDDPELQALTIDLQTAENRRLPLIERRDQIEIDAELASDPIGFFSPATFAEESVTLTMPRALVGGLILGLIAGLALAYVIGTRRVAFSSSREPELILGMPLLSDIPDFSGEDLDTSVPVRDAPRSAAAEAYRFVATAIERSLASRNGSIASITSSTIEHGKSTTTVNVALAAARQGSKVLVVDADFGSQKATSLLTGSEYNRSLGLTDVIANNTNVSEAIREIQMGNNVSISLISRGTHPSIAAEILRSTGADKLFRTLGGRFDIVLIDTPPILQVAYASTILGYADTALVVVRHDSQVSEFSDLVRRLKQTETDIMGYVYNKAPLSRQMRETQGSMQDVLGDAGRVVDPPKRTTARTNR